MLVLLGQQGVRELIVGRGQEGRGQRQRSADCSPWAKSCLPPLCSLCAKDNFHIFKCLKNKRILNFEWSSPIHACQPFGDTDSDACSLSWCLILSQLIHFHGGGEQRAKSPWLHIRSLAPLRSWLRTGLWWPLFKSSASLFGSEKNDLGSEVKQTWFQIPTLLSRHVN